MARSGLKKVVKTVRGKKGSVRRSYWMKSDPKAGKNGKRPGFLRRHAGKILGAAALVGGAYLAHRAGATAALRGAATHGRAAYKDAAAQRSSSGPKLGVRERLSGAVAAASHGARQGVGEHYSKVRSDAAEGRGGRIGAALAGASIGGAQGARLGVAMHGRERRRAPEKARADAHFDRAGYHLARGQKSGGIMGAYHHARASLHARAGKRAAHRARTMT
jgi:hypothetical protein